MRHMNADPIPALIFETGHEQKSGKNERRQPMTKPSFLASTLQTSMGIEIVKECHCPFGGSGGRIMYTTDINGNRIVTNVVVKLEEVTKTIEPIRYEKNETTRDTTRMFGTVKKCYKSIISFLRKYRLKVRCQSMATSFPRTFPR